MNCVRRSDEEDRGNCRNRCGVPYFRYLGKERAPSSFAERTNGLKRCCQTE